MTIPWVCIKQGICHLVIQFSLPNTLEECSYTKPSWHLRIRFTDFSRFFSKHSSFMPMFMHFLLVFRPFPGNIYVVFLTHLAPGQFGTAALARALKVDKDLHVRPKNLTPPTTMETHYTPQYTLIILYLCIRIPYCLYVYIYIYCFFWYFSICSYILYMYLRIFRYYSASTNYFSERLVSIWPFPLQARIRLWHTSPEPRWIYLGQSWAPSQRLTVRPWKAYLAPPKKERIVFLHFAIWFSGASTWMFQEVRKRM